jgi:hypothetical protein
LRRRRIAGGMVVHEPTVAAIGLSALYFSPSKKRLGTSIGDCNP